MTDRSTGETTRALRPTVAWALGLAALAGAAWVLYRGVYEGRYDRTGMSAGLVLGAAALGLLSTAVGQGSWGPAEEGRLDLSARLAAGALGGLLGGLAYLTVAWLGGLAGLPGLVGSGWEVRTGAGAWATRAFVGAGWGLLFGLLLRVLPGRGPVRKGLLFSIVPALWLLLVTFPGMEFGRLGVRLGALTFVPVVLYHLAWGLVTGRTVRWARETDLAPLSRSLGA